MNQELLRALRDDAARGTKTTSRFTASCCAATAPSSRPASTSSSSLRRPGRPGLLRPFRNVFLDCANLCEEMPKPVVCQIHRACIGGALEVALGCDMRIASSDSQLGLPEVKFGIIPDVGGSTRLPAVIGLGRAKDLIMTARMIDGVRGRADRSGQPRGRGRRARGGDEPRWSTSCSRTRRSRSAAPSA